MSWDMINVFTLRIALGLGVPHPLKLNREKIHQESDR